jgi:hypothetical protein
MPDLQRPAPRPINIGRTPGTFTAPVSEDDRDGPQGATAASNAAALESLAMYGDPFYGMYGMDPYLYEQPWLPAEAERWGDVEQTTMDTLTESGMLRRYGEDAVLIVANGPEDMKQLNHEAEAQNVASGRSTEQETVVLWNPSAEALTAMLREGGFRDVVVSGHGEEGVIYMTGADGAAVAVDGQTLAGMFEDTSVENVFLNVCHGAGGQASVANSLAEAGLNAMGWTGTVADGRATDVAAAWALLTQDGADVGDMDAVAGEHDDLVVEHEVPQPAPAAPAAEPAIDPALYQWDMQQLMWI